MIKGQCRDLAKAGMGSHLERVSWVTVLVGCQEILSYNISRLSGLEEHVNWDLRGPRIVLEYKVGLLVRVLCPPPLAADPTTEVKMKQWDAVNGRMMITGPQGAVLHLTCSCDWLSPHLL